MCGLEIRTRGEEVLSIKGDERDVYSQGHICPKGVALQDIHTDKDRLKYPIRKTGRGWERISWEEAFDTVEQRLRSIQDQHGPDAVALYMGNPGVHNTGTGLYFYDFANALGTRNRYASHSLDQLP
ncbi:MAG: molybdopterin-dependent oxidoreductase, partial [Phaeodactylibacter sp.]|nr:molybdopterin-dependent oxidoreductase [Phaeodactylibacter sp.]